MLDVLIGRESDREGVHDAGQGWDQGTKERGRGGDTGTVKERPVLCLMNGVVCFAGPAACWQPPRASPFIGFTLATVTLPSSGVTSNRTLPDRVQLRYTEAPPRAAPSRSAPAVGGRDAVA